LRQWLTRGRTTHALKAVKVRERAIATTNAQATNAIMTTTYRAQNSIVLPTQHDPLATALPIKPSSSVPGTIL
jgi:hypothetical protein